MSKDKKPKHISELQNWMYIVSVNDELIRNKELNETQKSFIEHCEETYDDIKPKVVIETDDRFRPKMVFEIGKEPRALTTEEREELYKAY